jgi:hypothetical protein
MSDAIEGIKLIYMTGNVQTADDPTYPFKLYVNLSPPELMQIAFIMKLGGSEEIVVRGMTRDAIDAFIKANDFKSHPRFRRMVISGPDNFREEIGR